jgi:Ca2+/Na+ antiporter
MYLEPMNAFLFRCCSYIEVAAERIVRREVAIGLGLVFVLSFVLAAGSEAIGWINTGALIAFCLLVILWALNKGQRELLGKLSVRSLG